MGIINEYSKKQTPRKVFDLSGPDDQPNILPASIDIADEKLFTVPEDLRSYLLGIIKKYNLEQFLQHLNSMVPLKVLVVGETIIDEYCYCETIGKSGKEPILASRYISSEKFAGGVLAIANHIAGFCQNVGVLSFLGAGNSHLDFIESKLNPAVTRHFLYVDGEPTITKRRYVEVYPLQKLFEVYEMNNCRENPACDEELCSTLDIILPQYDLVIVADYGHGMIDERAVSILCTKAPFLAVNTQVNADNRGFNNVSKYRRADYICISESEIRLEARNRSGDLEQIIKNVSNKMDCPKLLITQGNSGCLTYGREEGFFKTPAYTHHFVDRIGAGDAVLSITSPLVRLGMPAEMIGFVSNVVGALAVAVMGNREPVQKEQLIQYVVNLFELVSRGK